MTIFSYKGWPEIRKSEISLSEVCPIFEDCGELELPNLAHMSLIKCYWMLQNARTTAFTISELLRENLDYGIWTILKQDTDKLSFSSQSLLR